MVAICFYFQVHEPIRISKYRIFDIGDKEEYFDEDATKDNFSRISQRCYLPMNKLLLELIQKNNGKVKFTFSISGVAIEQMEKYEPEVLESFKRLAKTGCVEFLSETYYHSLSFLYSKEEFKEQILKHKELIKKHFDYEPKVFRNTELIYSNELASFVEEMGYKGIFAEGFDNVLGVKSPNVLYSAEDSNGEITLFTKNYKLYINNN
jgi:alpha-amylase